MADGGSGEMKPVRLLTLVLGIALALGIGAPAAPAQDAPKIDARLLRDLGTAAANDPLLVIVETVGNSHAAASSARAMGVQVVWEYDLIDAFAGRVLPSDVPRLAAQPWVEQVWRSEPVGALMDNSVKDIQATNAWNAGYNGAGVTVAILDTGIEVLDPAFAAAIVSCVSTVGGLTVPECDDTDGHGTHVAGTVASRDATFRGVAWGASVAAVRVLHVAGVGTSADIIAGMDWVRNNKDLVTPRIRVASMSIGFLDPGCGDGKGPEAEAADALVAAGVGFAIAAGNTGHNTCTVDGASAAFNVVTVGAADDKNTADPLDDTLADFSSGGPTKDGRLKPELSAPGVSIRSVFLGPTTTELDGTSMATPHVGGAMAVLLQKEPLLTPAQVKDRLQNTAIATNEATGTLPNNDWGHGLLNVCRLLQLSGCSQGATPRFVHVDSIGMSFRHQGAKHTVTTTVTVKDQNGALVQGVTVSLDLTNPAGTVVSLSGTTGNGGAATLSKSNAGGHGTYRACVTSLSGSYDPSANLETCDALNVTEAPAPSAAPTPAPARTGPRRGDARWPPGLGWGGRPRGGRAA